MINWNMTTPRKLISGRSSVSFLPELLKELNLKTPFVVIDPKVKKANFIKQLSDFCENSFDDFGTNPTFAQVSDGVLLFREGEYDSIIAVGGGSAIDLAKVVGLTAANGGVAEDYFQGKKAEIQPVPVVAVPTTCGTGAESSPFAVIMSPDVPKKRGIESSFLMPTAVILDPESLVSLDRVMIAATGMDAFTHILESHISRKATALTRIVSKGLLCSVRESLEKAVKDKDISALETLQSIAFTARLLYPRTGLSIAHALSHPLGAFTGMHHGLAVAMFLEASMKFNLPSCTDSFQEAEKVMGFSCGGGLLSWVRSIIEESGMMAEISDYLASFHSLSIERIASEALESSNIPSNPRKIGLTETCEIINESLADFGR
ncbi:MAG TPA: iron-containing alcohol dehydrogenase [Candidatus Moranbacteria bacterium]|nr:iron-containing alcohol dehydrogenase [Candidatus Moranbacteria bacterium]